MLQKQKQLEITLSGLHVDQLCVVVEGCGVDADAHEGRAGGREGLVHVVAQQLGGEGVELEMTKLINLYYLSLQDL